MWLFRTRLDKLQTQVKNSVLIRIHHLAILIFRAFLRLKWIGHHFWCPIFIRQLSYYVNEYAFRYNHRNDVEPKFLTFLSRVAYQLVD